MNSDQRAMLEKALEHLREAERLIRLVDPYEVLIKQLLEDTLEWVEYELSPIAPT